MQQIENNRSIHYRAPRGRRFNVLTPLSVFDIFIRIHQVAVYGEVVSQTLKIHEASGTNCFQWRCIRRNKRWAKWRGFVSFHVCVSDIARWIPRLYCTDGYNRRFTERLSLNTNLKLWQFFCMWEYYIPAILLYWHSKLDGCIVWNAHSTVLGEEALLICVVPVCYAKTGGYGKT